MNRVNKKEIQNIGNLFILASAILFSLAGVLIKMISWSPITINGMRNIFAFIVMLIYLKKTVHKIVINKIVLLGALCNLFMNLTFVMATKLTSAANAIVLQFTEPIFLILFLIIIWKHKPVKKEVITCVLVFGGILCFFFDKISLEGVVGNILAIISGALYAFVFLIKKTKNADFESSVLISQLVSFILSMPWYFKERDYSINNFTLIMILGVFQLGLAYVLLAKGLDRVSPIAASLTSTIEPILNPIWVAMFYGEMIQPVAMVGAAIVIISATTYNVLGSFERNYTEKEDRIIG
jgi:drug/metabolite transporter (DMT)-like permease